MSEESTHAGTTEMPAPGTDGTVAAFDLLSNEGRLAILWALWETIEPGREQTPTSFSELASRCTYDSPGNLSYHLDKLVGEFVHKTEGGYLLTGTGQKLIGAIRAGAMTRRVSFGPFKIDEPCPYCGGTVEVSYADNYIMARCTACGGTYPESGPAVLDGHPDGPTGVITNCEFPPAGVQARDPGESLRSYLTRSAYQAFVMLADTCPECAGRTSVRTTVCRDHDEGDDVCETCGFQYLGQTLLVCKHCKLMIPAATRWLPLHHPTVAAFFQERGVDARPGFSMELWAVLDQADVAVRSTDPVELEFDYRVDGDTLGVRVDGDLQVMAITR